jgi:hypothetical protein
LKIAYKEKTKTQRLNNANYLINTKVGELKTQLDKAKAESLGYIAITTIN